jgi:hypothetical protein
VLRNEIGAVLCNKTATVLAIWVQVKWQAVVLRSAKLSLYCRCQSLCEERGIE